MASNESAAAAGTGEWDIEAEAERLFDNSSLPADGQPEAGVIAGAVAVGKTTHRKQKYASGYVLIDAADIFLGLSRGDILPFPGPLEEPMEQVGRLVTRRVLTERRNSVTEIIGAEAGPVEELIGALRSVGYRVKGEFLTCDTEEALRRTTRAGRTTYRRTMPSPSSGPGSSMPARSWPVDERAEAGVRRTHCAVVDAAGR